jgi:hypothetical protein
MEEIEAKRVAAAQLFSLSKLKCSMLWQKPRMKWLKEGDANTKFFHRCMLNRRRINEISYIETNDRKVTEVQEIKQEIFYHFSALFKEQSVNRPLLENMDFNCIGVEENAVLTAEFSEEEIRKAVWECESSKCPGPDGINFGFIKEFWDVIKVDFQRFISEFHTNGRITRGANSAFITLIPKVENPVKLNEFRPISLIGCMYKVLSKILENRLKGVAQKLISAPQFAFLESILIANEIVDDAKRKKREVLMFKVDFEKAYDSVDWKYLDYVMRRMIFKDKWRGWIAECLSSSRLSVLVNGPYKRVYLGKGIATRRSFVAFLISIGSRRFQRNDVKSCAIEYL